MSTTHSPEPDVASASEKRRVGSWRLRFTRFLEQILLDLPLRFHPAADQLTDGRRFRMPTIVDDCTRECLSLVADTSLSGIRVAGELDRVSPEQANLWMLQIKLDMAACAPKRMIKVQIVSVTALRVRML
jgi:hypothetical protein